MLEGLSGTSNTVSVYDHLVHMTRSYYCIWLSFLSNTIYILYFSLCSSLEEIAETGVSKGGGSLQLVLSSGERFPLYTARARQIDAIINAFTREAAGAANTTINREMHHARMVVSRSACVEKIKFPMPSENAFLFEFICC